MTTQTTMRRLCVFLETPVDTGDSLLSGIQGLMPGWSVEPQILAAGENPTRRIIASRCALAVGRQAHLGNLLQRHEFYENGACLAWMIAPPGHRPIWILAPGRGELANVLEPAIQASRLRSYGSRIGLSERKPQVAALILPDGHSWKIVARTARILSGSEPFLLSLAGDRLPLISRRIRELLCAGIGPESLSIAEEMTPEQAVQLLARGHWNALPAVILASNLHAGMLAAAGEAAAGAGHVAFSLVGSRSVLSVQAIPAHGAAAVDPSVAMAALAALAELHSEIPAAPIAGRVQS